MMTQLDDFETRLLNSLRAEVAQRPQRRPRRGVLVAAGVAASAAAFVIIPGPQESPAFSVVEGNAGEITVEIARPEDPIGLERALEEHGIEADITYLRGRQTCAPGRYTEVDRSSPGLMTSIGGRSIAVTIPAGTVRDGETFVLTWSVQPMAEEELEAPNAESHDGAVTVGGFHVTVDAAVVTGPINPCAPVPLSPTSR